MSQQQTDRDSFESKNYYRVEFTKARKKDERKIIFINDYNNKDWLKSDRYENLKEMR